MKTSKLVLQELMKVRNDDNFIAGERRSLADFHLAPVCFYVALTPDAGKVFGVKGFTPWWVRMQALPSYDRPRRNWANGLAAWACGRSKGQARLELQRQRSACSLLRHGVAPCCEFHIGPLSSSEGLEPISDEVAGTREQHRHCRVGWPEGT